jgi:hypothetical protein
MLDLAESESSRTWFPDKDHIPITPPLPTAFARLQMRKSKFFVLYPSDATNFFISFKYVDFPGSDEIIGTILMGAADQLFDEFYA